MPAAIYARISRDRIGSHLGVDRQEADCRKLAKSLGWTVADVFIDNDLSAFTRRKARPAYQRLLAAVDEGTVDAIVCWHPDRLHRSNAELEPFIALVEKAGTAIATVQAGAYDLSTPSGRMAARIVGAVAQHESEHKQARIRRKHLELAHDGAVSGGGMRPFGYEADRVTVRDAEAAEIRDAARRLLAGESLRSIAEDWKDRVPTVTGAAWSPVTIRRLLRSGRISGQREHHGVIVGPAQWPAIIDPDYTVRLRALLAEHRTGVAQPRTNVLSGMLRCTCGAPMISRPVRRKGIRYRRYSCNPNAGGCGRYGIIAEATEEVVVAAALRTLDSAKLARKVARRKRPVVGVDEVRRLEARQVELAEGFAAGEMPRAAHAAAQASIARQLDQANARLAAASRPPVEEFLGRGAELADQWDTLGMLRQRQVLDSVIDTVDVAASTRAANKFDADRLTIHWRH